MTVSQPGAYAGAQGEAFQRRDAIQSSRYFSQPALGARMLEEGNNNGSSTGLSEAFPVNDDLVPDMEAHPFDMGALKRRELLLLEKRKKQLKHFLVLALTIACIVVGIILGVIFHKRNIDSGKLISAALVPSSAPSESPSFAPSGVLDFLREDLPEYTLESLDTFDTPQWRAWSWLSRHPKLQELPEWRKKQLFALATFYYSFQNQKWKDDVRGDWLDATTHECNWFTSQQGQYDENGSFVYYDCPPNATSCSDERGDIAGILPCDNQGRFESLILIELMTTETPTTATLPLEMSLLPNLRRMGLSGSRINSSLVDFGVHHVTQLEGFQIRQNELFGTIPSGIGQMTNLQRCVLSFNKLTGSIPNQVGTMSRLEFIAVASNSLSGTIPDQVWSIDGLEVFFAFDNYLTGTISSDIADTVWWLNVRGNSLTGSVPSEVGLLKELLELDLGDNQFGGSLPTELGLLQNLTKLSLGNNQFSDRIPSELGRLTNLKELLLSGNEFLRAVPSELGLLTKMERLHLNTNALTGEAIIPSQIALLTNLVEYDFERPNATLVEP